MVNTLIARFYCRGHFGRLTFLVGFNASWLMVDDSPCILISIGLYHFKCFRIVLFLLSCLESWKWSLHMFGWLDIVLLPFFPHLLLFFLLYDYFLNFIRICSFAYYFPLAMEFLIVDHILSYSCVREGWILLFAVCCLLRCASCGADYASQMVDIMFMLVPIYCVLPFYLWQCPNW